MAAQGHPRSPGHDHELPWSPAARPSEPRLATLPEPYTWVWLSLWTGPVLAQSTPRFRTRPVVSESYYAMRCRSDGEMCAAAPADRGRSRLRRVRTSTPGGVHTGHGTRCAARAARHAARPTHVRDRVLTHIHLVRPIGDNVPACTVHCRLRTTVTGDLILILKSGWEDSV